MDLDAYEYIGAGNELCKFWDLAGIVKCEAADAQVGGRLETAAVAHRIRVDHAVTCDTNGREHLHLAGRGHIEVRAEGSQALRMPSCGLALTA